MDADAQLARMREVQYQIDGYNDAGDPGLMREWRRMAERMAELFAELDGYLQSGGRPPEEWAEGPLDRDPLGGPVPGVAGSHLPDDEHRDQGCVRCGNLIRWYGDTWAHVSPGRSDHPATAAIWPGAAIANEEPGR